VPQFGIPWPPTASDVIAHLHKPSLLENLRWRSRVKQTARDVLTEMDFVEIDSPTFGPPIEEYTQQQLGTRTPDGRDFYLNQSPQYFKQAMVVHGFDRIFQFAHCFRWEELDPERKDQVRGLVQLDLEMAADDPATVRAMIESMVATLCERLGIGCPRPFPVLDAAKCMAEYGTDKPYFPSAEGELGFTWVVDFPFFVERGGVRKPPNRHIFCRPWSDPRTLTDPAELSALRTMSYDLVVNGQEVAGGDVRINDAGLLEHVVDFFGLPRESFRILVETLGDGARPHGGIAIGLDRLVMNLAGADHILDVNAFPQWII
jgi:aspartyl-tRNA synthetase